MNFTSKAGSLSFRMVLENSSVKIDTVMTYCHYCLNDTSLSGYLPYFKVRWTERNHRIESIQTIYFWNFTLSNVLFHHGGFSFHLWALVCI